MVRISNQNKRITGCLDFCPPDGNILNKPVILLGGTVLSFNASLGIGPTQESTFSVELINDCKVSGADSPTHFPAGEYFHGAASIGGPVFFDSREHFCLPIGYSGFKFGGILASYEAKQGSGGETFSARIIDPRSLLNHAMVIVDSYLEGPIKHRNYFNAYAYYEYSILPKESKSIIPHPFGVPNTGVAFLSQPEAQKGLTYSPYENYDKKTFPAGYEVFESSFDDDAALLAELNNIGEMPADCTFFGTADTTERGMSARKVLQALKNMEPLIYSPNYGEPYRPFLRNKDIIAAAGRLHHELNVFRLDMSGFPEPPPFMRIAGPSVSILELLTQICEVSGREFTVTLEESDDGGPNRIRIQTKKPDNSLADPQNILDTVIDFNGAAVELSFGEELRTDKSRTILLGEQEHVLAECSSIQFFFGEDSNGDPIVPVLNNSKKCGFEVAFEVDELNKMLSCPLFDPDLHNVVLSIDQKVLSKRVVVSEADIRTALSSIELWKIRVGSSNVPELEMKTEYPPQNNTIDFNYVVRYNFQDILSTSVADVMNQLAGNATEQLVRANGFVDNAVDKASQDALSNTDRRYIGSLISERKKDLETVYDWLKNIGNTYYGKQYIVALPTGVCAIPAGLYDENYFGINDENVPESMDSYVPPDCEGEEFDPGDPELNNKIYRPTQFSHIPTNEGGWVEPCMPVLGLDEPELSFFKTEDFRVGCFAKFTSRDINVQFESTLVGTSDISPRQPGEPIQTNNINQTLEKEGAPILAVINGVCGEIDTTQFSPDQYILIRESGTGTCSLPEYPPDESGNFPVMNTFNDAGPVPTGYRPAVTGDLPFSIWIKASVDEKLYVIKTEDIICEDQPDGICTNIAKAVIKFDSPCLKKPCADTPITDIHKIFVAAMQNAGILQEKVVEKTEEGTPETTPETRDDDGAGRHRDSTQQLICGIPVESGLYAFVSSLDSASVNNVGYHPSADLPATACIPLKSNVSSYGPWYSPNFNDSSGGIDFQRNNDFCPWNFSSMKVMNYVAAETLKEAQTNLSELEKGSITHPGPPLLSVGFLDNGPNLTAVNVSFGGNGISTNYEFQTYTPKFGGLKTLESQALREAVKNRQRAQRIIKDELITKNKINRRLNGFSNDLKDRKGTKPKKDESGTLQRVIMGEIYDFSLIRDHNDPIEGNVIGSGQRTTVGMDTLSKSELEMRFGYENKAYMSLDGFFSPISISGDGGLPMFPIKYNGYLEAFKSNTIAPNPPIFLSGDTAINSGTGIGIEINNSYLNPLQNHFESDTHPHHSGAGAGHTIDLVGREEKVPVTGMIMNFYGQQDWDNRYADDYRFLGLKGPLVLHSWGYDTEGKPVPNLVDRESDIRQSGLFANSGLKDYFLQDWLHKPATWPVAPIDLRFDRERGVWVSPPQNKIIVAETITNVPAHGIGTGILVNSRSGTSYGKDIFDTSGNLIHASGTIDNKIVIEDRLGISTGSGEKRYAYFDTFSSTYLLIGGGGGMKLGKTGVFSWTKGSSEMIRLWPNGVESNPEEYQIAKNMFTTVQPDKFVMIAREDSGDWYLISAECD